MKLFTVNFTFDGEKVSGASGLTSEAAHAFNLNLPTARWHEAAGSGHIFDLLDLVVEQLAVFSDTLHVANKQLRRRSEQLELPFDGLSSYVRGHRAAALGDL